MFDCGGGRIQPTPCDAVESTSCETECLTTEYCMSKKGDEYYCAQEGDEKGCCVLDPRWDTKGFDCATFECNSHGYCQAWNRHAHCGNGCCKKAGSSTHFVSWNGTFTDYRCARHKSFTPCIKKASCERECVTTQHCLRVLGEGFFCHPTTGCCTENPSYGKGALSHCKTMECNSHAFCKSKLPGSNCQKGCCAPNADPIPTVVTSPPVPDVTPPLITSPPIIEPVTIVTPGVTPPLITSPPIILPESTLAPIVTSPPLVDPPKPQVKPPVFVRDKGRNVTTCADLHADIVLVIDASGSITAPIFNTHTKKFAKAVIDRFDVGATRTRIGLVAYSADVYYTLDLTACSDVACLMSAVDALTYEAAGTCTGDGIEAATEMLLKAPVPPGEMSRSKAIIVITDGHEECGSGVPSSVPDRCNQARGKGIDLYAVAVGTKTFITKPAAIADLDAICGGDSTKKFIVENYEALDSVFVERLQRQVCSTTWQVIGRCEQTECYTDAYCDKKSAGTVCRGGCCVEKKTEVPDPIIINECTFLAADVILVIDGSGSITAPIFNTHTKTFVKELISRFNVGFSRTRIGIVAYSSDVYYTLSLEECADQDCLVEKINNLEYPSGDLSTCTGDAIQTAKGMFELATKVGKDERPQVIIVVTDGHEECGGESTVPKHADEARAAGIDLFAVAVGTETFMKKPAAIADLKAISNNDDKRQFVAKDYASLDYSFVDNLQKEVCTTTTVVVIDKSKTCQQQCRTSAFCRRSDKNTRCRNGCCVPGKGWDDNKIVRPPRAITYCYGLHADIVLVIDASGSITAPIFNAQTKMFAKSLVGRFDVGPTKTRIGIVAYAASVYYTQDVTECLDVNCLYAKIDALSYPAGGTCTGDGIAKATELINAAPAPNFYERNRARVIIVITDGHEECGSGASTVPARCSAAREDDIELFAVAVGDTFRNKPAAIADLNAISNNDENNKFFASNYDALDNKFVERLQREVCSTEFRRWGKENCEHECHTNGYCGRMKAGTVCRRGCCVKDNVTIPVTPIFEAECKYASADVVLVIDASGSITAPIFNTHTKNFAKDLIDRFNVSATRSRIGIVAYSADVYATHQLTECNNKECVKDKIGSLKYPAGGTCTGDAVEEATKMLRDTPSPDGLDRPRVIIVITDGHEECGGPSTVPKQCDAARAEGIELFAVAVGTDTFLTKPAAIADLNAIADNRDERKFIAKDYASLDFAFVDDLQKEVCSTTVKEGIDEDCKAECKSHIQCAFLAPGTKCVSGCCQVPDESGKGNGGIVACPDKKPRWCRKNKKQCKTDRAMRTTCPRTCGFCDGTTIPKAKCFDKKGDGWCKKNLRNCNKGKQQCKMRDGCAATCGFCRDEDGTPPPTLPPVVETCGDTTLDCGKKKWLCLNPAYNTMMLEHCPKTCKLCGGQVNPPVATSPPLILPPITTEAPTAAPTEAPTKPPATNCVDTATDCGIKAGLCNNNAYKSLMTKRCKRTCGWC